MEKLYPHDEDFNLDGSHSVQPAEFDSHDQVVRASNPENFQEYPKAVNHVERPDGHLEPVIVGSKEEEDAYDAAKGNR